MSKFKVGDSVRLINPKGWGGKRKGSIYKIAEVGKVAYDLDDGTVVAFMYESDFELAEDSAPVAGMSKFKVGDKVRVLTVDSLDKKHGVEIGDIVTVDEDDDTPECITKKGRHVFRECQLELVTEDRTTWHPHHDVIMAWAKGASVQGTSPCGNVTVVYASGELSNPSFFPDWNWEIIEEPDHTAEIAEIERKMRDLSWCQNNLATSQKELADRLEKLKQ